MNHYFTDITKHLNLKCDAIHQLQITGSYPITKAKF